MNLVPKRNYYSLICILILSYILFRTAFLCPKWTFGGANAVISWDVFGYYLYLPSYFIYDDLGHLNFIQPLFEKYAPAGDFHHAVLQPDGKYVMKYAIGLSLLFLPFFFIGHFWAQTGGYPLDGLSYPYQFCIEMGSIMVAVIGLFVLRKILLKYFDDLTTCITITAIVLGTNYFEYATLSAAMTHNYLFTMYAIVILLTISWHENPKIWKAVGMGFVIGIITITRPTDCIIALIPILWGIKNKTDLVNKFKLFLKFKWHLVLFAICGFIAVLPQFIYWKIYSGHFIYYSYGEQGFSFLKPHILNGLFSYKKGWLVYTPMMIFPIIGFIMLYRNFRNIFYPVFFFFLLNVYLVFSWNIWWYGGGLGARAMVESYALLAFPFAAFIAYILTKKISRIITFVVILWFIEVNLFMDWQAHAHQGGWQAEMTRDYFWRVFNNSYVQKADLKYLDVTKDRDTTDMREIILLSHDMESDSGTTDQHACSGKRSIRLDQFHQYSPKYTVPVSSVKIKAGSFLRISTHIFYKDMEWNEWRLAQLVLGIQKKDGSFPARVLRLQRLTDAWQCYNAFFDYKLPDDISKDDTITAYVWNAESQKEIFIDDFQVKLYEPK